MRKGRIEWSIRETGGLSMKQASKISGVSYPTFRKWAKLFGLWKPNQSGTKKGQTQIEGKGQTQNCYCYVIRRFGVN